MRRAPALLFFLMSAACGPDAPATAVGSVRQPIEASVEAFGGGEGFRLGASLAVCPSRSLLAGAPGAFPGARIWRTSPGQPQAMLVTPIPLEASMSPGVSVSCGSAFQVGAPGSDSVPSAPSAVYFSATTGVYDGGLGSRLGTSMATLPPRADGGAERYVVGAPGLGAVLIYSNAPNPSVSLVLPTGTPSAVGTSVVVGDFNGDGRADLAVGAVAQVLLFLQQSSGAFAQSPLNLVPGGLAGKPSLGTALAVSPALGSQRQQLAVGVPEVNSVYLVSLAADGGVDFSPTLVGSPSNSALFGTAVALGDFDQDGVVELFAAAPGDGAGRVTRWVLDGGWSQVAGDFVPPPGTIPGAGYGRAIAVGDIGGNAGPELIVGAPSFKNTFVGEGAYFVYAFDGGADAGPTSGACMSAAQCPLWCNAPQDCLNQACVPIAPACAQGEACLPDIVLGGICVALGPADAGSPDAGSPDAGSPDAGSPDAGAPDGGERDAGSPDAGSPDAGSPDAGSPDAGAPDGGERDAGLRDAGLPDAGGSDAGAGDEGTADGGVRSVSYQSCGCSGAGPLQGALVVLLRLIWRRRRLAA